MRVLIGCEHTGAVRRAFRARGHDAWSNDILPATDLDPHHLQCDVLTILDRGWDLAIFHPDCTYLTCSAEWAYKDPDFSRYPGVGYHQRLKPETLFGEARREARRKAVEFCRKLLAAPIQRIAMENPIGHLSKAIRKPEQTIQPNWFGEDASKATCLWLKNLPPLVKTKQIEPRWVNGKPRWANQTDGGQNRESPAEDRWAVRAATYPGIANAMADQWGGSQVMLSPSVQPNLFGAEHAEA